MKGNKVVFLDYFPRITMGNEPSFPTPWEMTWEVISLQIRSVNQMGPKSFKLLGRPMGPAYMALLNESLIKH